MISKSKEFIAKIILQRISIGQNGTDYFQKLKRNQQGKIKIFYLSNGIDSAVILNMHMK